MSEMTTDAAPVRKFKTARDYRAEIDATETSREQIRARLSAYVLTAKPSNRHRIWGATAQFTSWYESGQDIATYAKGIEMKVENFRLSVKRMAMVALDPAYDQVENTMGDLVEAFTTRPDIFTSGVKAPVQHREKIGYGDFMDDREGQNWRTEAICAKVLDPEIFFPEKGGTTYAAKKICATCEVAAQCLEYALTHDEKTGVWGGKSYLERQKILRARKKTRALSTTTVS